MIDFLSNVFYNIIQQKKLRFQVYRIKKRRQKFWPQGLLPIKKIYLKLTGLEFYLFVVKLT